MYNVKSKLKLKLTHKGWLFINVMIVTKLNDENENVSIKWQ